VEKERVTDWVKRGAIPSNTLARLLRKNGMTGMEKYIQKYTKQKSKSAVEEAPAAPVIAAPAPAAAPVQAASDDTATQPA
jgi:hypothetical protein